MGKQSNSSMSSNWRSKHTEAIAAHPLMAAEINWHRQTTSLEREIKRLRSEVGLMAKRYHGAKREISDMVKRLRAQPPPPVPARPTKDKKDEEKDTDMGEASSPPPPPSPSSTGSTTPRATTPTPRPPKAKPSSSPPPPPPAPKPRPRPRDTPKPKAAAAKEWAPSEQTDHIHEAVETNQLNGYIEDYPKTARYRAIKWREAIRAADGETKGRIRDWKGKVELEWMRTMDEEIVRAAEERGVRTNKTDRDLYLTITEREKEEKEEKRRRKKEKEAAGPE